MTVSGASCEDEIDSGNPVQYQCVLTMLDGQTAASSDSTDSGNLRIKGNVSIFSIYISELHPLSKISVLKSVHNNNI